MYYNRRSIQANPLTPRPYLMVAQIHAKLGNPDKASQALSRMEQVFGQVCQRCYEASVKAGGGGGGGLAGPCARDDTCDEVRNGLVKMRPQLKSEL